MPETEPEQRIATPTTVLWQEHDPLFPRAWADRLDVFFANGAAVPGLEKDAPKYSNRLFRNLGGMKFEDVTGGAGLAGRGYDMAAAVAD